MPLPGEEPNMAEELHVISPYDGSPIGSVPKCSAADVDRAVRAAAAVMADAPLAPFERAEILDRAAVLLRERHEEFARTIAIEAAKPIKSARVEATRAVSTFQ